MEKRGLRWLPVEPWRFDNNSHNYDFKRRTEEEYQKALKSQEEKIRWYAEVDEGDDEPGTAPWWLKLPIEEKLKAPDSDFVYDGLHKSLMPVIICSGRNAERSLFRGNHKGSGYKRIRVPSMKRNNAEWYKFYNEFPRVAAEVRLGNRRFINGAKLKYIW
jgi:hypothetical protein